MLVKVMLGTKETNGVVQVRGGIPYHINEVKERDFREAVSVVRMGRGKPRKSWDFKLQT